MASMNLAMRSVSDSSGSAHSADVRWLADSLPAGPRSAHGCPAAGSPLVLLLQQLRECQRRRLQR